MKIRMRRYLVKVANLNRDPVLRRLLQAAADEFGYSSRPAGALRVFCDAQTLDHILHLLVCIDRH
jgi:hypothetical protein